MYESPYNLQTFAEVSALLIDIYIVNTFMLVMYSRLCQGA